MKTLITGGTGFIGSHLCDLLLAKGYEVVCVDNLITGSAKNIEHIDNERFSYIRHDVTNPLYVDYNVDFIFHLASPASPIDYLELPIQTLKVGALGTYNMLGLAKEKGARFLLASTSEVYGDPLINPQTEEYWGNVNPIGPRGVYDEAKRYAEAITMAYHRYHRLDTRIVRIFNTYGPRMHPEDGRVTVGFVVQAIRNQPFTVYGDGQQTRSFCYVSDTVEGLTKLMFSDETNGEVINLGNPEEHTINELVDLVAEKVGVEKKIERLPLPGDDPMRRQPDITKAKEILGWEPKVSLDEGLDKTIEYFRKVLV